MRRVCPVPPLVPRPVEHPRGSHSLLPKGQIVGAKTMHDWSMQTDGRHQCFHSHEGCPHNDYSPRMRPWAIPHAQVFPGPSVEVDAKCLSLLTTYQARCFEEFRKTYS